MICWVLPPRISSTSYRMPLMPVPGRCSGWQSSGGAKPCMYRVPVHRDGGGRARGAERFYAGLRAGLETLEGLDGCEAFTLLELDADNTGATVE